MPEASKLTYNDSLSDRSISTHFPVRSFDVFDGLSFNFTRHISLIGDYNSVKPKILKNNVVFAQNI